MSANTHKHTHTHRSTHRQACAHSASRQKQKCACEWDKIPGWLCRGHGSAEHSSLRKREARLGCWREERRPEPSYQAAAAPLLSKPRAWESDSHLLGLSLGDPDVTVIRRGKEKSPKNKLLSLMLFLHFYTFFWPLRRWTDGGLLSTVSSPPPPCEPRIWPCPSAQRGLISSLDVSNRQPASSATALCWDALRSSARSICTTAAAHHFYSGSRAHALAACSHHHNVHVCLCQTKACQCPTEDVDVDD